MILMMIMSFVALFNVIMFFGFTDEIVKFKTETEVENESESQLIIKPKQIEIANNKNN